MTQGKSERKKRWIEHLILLGLVIICLVFARATWSLYQKNQAALNNLHASTRRIEKLTERESVLRDKIERLKTPRGVEEEIRNNFPMVKPGEQVINLVDKEKPASTTTATATKPWWQIF
ncbi:MAG: septum formation initiator family protein [Candidatus Paceibacterota bacterium]|jgi:cell division protein FtsB